MIHNVSQSWYEVIYVEYTSTGCLVFMYLLFSHVFSNYQLISYSMILGGFWPSSESAVGKTKDSVGSVMISPVTAKELGKYMYIRLYVRHYQIQKFNDKNVHHVISV